MQAAIQVSFFYSTVKLGRNSMFSKMKNQKGFTLVEMAVVLVIIGIILGAVLKGQDIVTNARAKKLASTVNTWEALLYAYTDRIGRFPGDITNRNGVIGNVAGEQTAVASAIGEMSAAGVFANPPQNPVGIGGSSFWIYLGNRPLGTGAKNVMLICKTVDCAGATFFTTEEIAIIQAVDTMIDGLADAGMGQFRAVAAGTISLAPAAPALINNRMSAAVTDAVAISETPAGVATLWTAGTHRAAVWMFDKSY